MQSGVQLRPGCLRCEHTFPTESAVPASSNSEMFGTLECQKPSIAEPHPETQDDRLYDTSLAGEAVTLSFLAEPRRVTFCKHES